MWAIFGPGTTRIVYYELDDRACKVSFSVGSLTQREVNRNPRFSGTVISSVRGTPCHFCQSQGHWTPPNISADFRPQGRMPNISAPVNWQFTAKKRNG